MKLSTTCLITSLLFCCLFKVHGYLPLPPPLVPLNSRMGEKMLMEATYKSDAYLLLQHFTTQINGAFCGVASSAMLLNALEVPRPTNSEPVLDQNPAYNYYDQVNVFNNNTEAIIPQSTVAKQGMTLDELAAFLGAHPGIGSLARHARSMAGGLEEFRSIIVSSLCQNGTFVVLNFNRATGVNEAGGGHHSPLAAYHQASDSVLVLDVSRYKYNAWWSPVNLLWESVQPSDSADPLMMGRGLVVAWALSSSAMARIGPEFITPGLDNNEPLLLPSSCPPHDNTPDGSESYVVVVSAVLLGAGLLAVAFFGLVLAGTVKVEVQSGSNGNSLHVNGSSNIVTVSDGSQVSDEGGAYKVNGSEATPLMQGVIVKKD
jgi:hypothetical protein